MLYIYNFTLMYSYFVFSKNSLITFVLKKGDQQITSIMLELVRPIKSAIDIMLFEKKMFLFQKFVTLQ